MLTTDSFQNKVLFHENQGNTLTFRVNKLNVLHALKLQYVQYGFISFGFEGSVSVDKLKQLSSSSICKREKLEFSM